MKKSNVLRWLKMRYRNGGKRMASLPGSLLGEREPTYGWRQKLISFMKESGTGSIAKGSSITSEPFSLSQYVVGSQRIARRQS